MKRILFSIVMSMFVASCSEPTQISAKIIGKYATDRNSILGNIIGSAKTIKERQVMSHNFVKPRYFIKFSVNDGILTCQIKGDDWGRYKVGDTKIITVYDRETKCGAIIKGWETLTSATP